MLLGERSRAVIDGQWDFQLELRDSPTTDRPPLFAEHATADVAELVEEAFVRGVLADRLPESPDELAVTVRPVWAPQPLVGALEVELTAPSSEGERTYRRRFQSGPWARRAELAAMALQERGALAKGQTVYRVLAATHRDEPVAIDAPPLEAPPIEEETLEEFGVARLGDGEFQTDRPILINARMHEEIIQKTIDSSTAETGGGVLAKIIRLPEPLKGTTTPIVTILAAGMTDDRHKGRVGSFQFSPDALAEAQQISMLRGKGERVLTVWHSHGWGSDCGNCNQNADCVLPQNTLVSAADYQVLESLFPSKATLMPIAGRKLGEQGKRPVLVVQAWSGGEMRPVKWRLYED